MKIPLLPAVVVVIIFLFIPKNTTVERIQTIEPRPIISQESQLNVLIRRFLADKESPLASETDFFLQQKHWKLLIAISAIESQYCRRKLGNNCWGIGGEKNYRYYDSIRDSIFDANNFIQSWQDKERWLTVEDMNCSYNVPCSDNWVSVVNMVIVELEIYERQSFGEIH